MKLQNSSLYIIICTAIILTGCVRGGGLIDSDIAKNPAGEQVTLSVQKELVYYNLTGELLAFQDDIFFVVRDQKIYKERVQDIDEIKFLGREKRLRVSDDGVITYRIRPPEDVQKLIVTHTRYPQGISDALMEKLLEAYEQDEILIFQQ